jgi:hypothetical protein
MLVFCRRWANCTGVRVAAHALTIFVIEEGVRLGAETISRMRDRTIVCFSFFRRKENKLGRLQLMEWTESNSDADREISSYVGGASIDFLSSKTLDFKVAIMKAKGKEKIGA